MKLNYQLKMEDMIEKLPTDRTPTLLLHSCCGPCSSAVLEALAPHFKITIYYYNPNISPSSEFRIRLEEQKRFLQKMTFLNEVSIIEGLYEHDVFEEKINPYRDLKEGSVRCFTCYQLRLEKTAMKAKELNFDYFTTTLSISPHKNSQVLNEIGKVVEAEYGIQYLYADFKKKEGYKRSIQLSEQYHLYRQDYCGCVYSKKEMDARKKE